MRVEFLNILTLQINTSHNLEIVDYEHCQNDTQMGCIFSVSRPDHMTPIEAAGNLHILQLLCSLQHATQKLVLYFFTSTMM